MDGPRNSGSRSKATPSNGAGCVLPGLQRGDPAALQLLLDRYWQPLVRFGQSLGSSEDGAEDLAQEAILALWRRRGEGIFPGSVRAFLFRVIRNGVAREYRTELSRDRLADDAARVLYAPPSTPLEELERARRLDILEEALGSLPPRRREVLVLARFHGLSHDEIAQILDLSRQTVANHITLALRDLRAAILHPLTGR